MAIHKSLMFAISHAAWQTLQAFAKTSKVYFTFYAVLTPVRRHGNMHT